MTAAKHTKGPWHYTKDVDGRFVIEVDGDVGRHALAVTGGKFWYSEANARLIAAAPELLAALRYTLAYAESMEHALGADVGGRNTTLDVARDAIARATGEESGS